VTVVKL